jgi:hypothetical protein
MRFTTRLYGPFFGRRAPAPPQFPQSFVLGTRGLAEHTLLTPPAKDRLRQMGAAAQQSLSMTQSSYKQEASGSSTGAVVAGAALGSGIGSVGALDKTTPTEHAGESPHSPVKTESAGAEHNSELESQSLFLSRTTIK